jgi:hypothetical protein
VVQDFATMHNILFVGFDSLITSGLLSAFSRSWPPIMVNRRNPIVFKHLIYIMHVKCNVVVYHISKYIPVSWKQKMHTSQNPDILLRRLPSNKGQVPDQTLLMEKTLLSSLALDHISSSPGQNVLISN